MIINTNDLLNIYYILNCVDPFTMHYIAFIKINVHVQSGNSVFKICELEKFNFCYFLWELQLL